MLGALLKLRAGEAALTAETWHWESHVLCRSSPSPISQNQEQNPFCAVSLQYTLLSKLQQHTHQKTTIKNKTKEKTRKNL